MTQKQIERILRLWQKRLRLEHWDLEIDWSAPADDGNFADITRADHYDLARIKLNAAWQTWSLEFAATTIVHELLHCHDRDLQESIKSLEGDKTWATHEVEGLVDRLAVVFVDLGGAVG